VVNAGLIAGQTYQGVFIQGGGSVTNEVGGTIEGGASPTLTSGNYTLAAGNGVESRSRRRILRLPIADPGGFARLWRHEIEARRKADWSLLGAPTALEPESTALAA
jgi:hypothetical protein